MEKEKIRARIKVSGIVQGVGFRPFVYRLATSLKLNGFVKNMVTGVLIEIEGSKKSIEIFLKRIKEDKPSISKIENIQVAFLSPIGYKNFEISKSSEDLGEVSLVSPDIAICNECIEDILDTNNRRYRYPFTNCTQCGPRFTIIKALPYDRINTTMRKFKMCKECEEEYNNIFDRRYHAQPNACHLCGPKIWFEEKNNKNKFFNEEAIEKTIEAIREGKIIAIKGLGGFHLACDATNELIVKELRKRKNRMFKPFAIMSFSIDKIKNFCYVNEFEESILSSNERPIVLLRKKDVNIIAESVSPNNNYLGVMLPYTPLHYLILKELNNIDALVMTSGNIKDEPIVTKNKIARIKLSRLADAFLMHNRDIYNRCDDSIVTLINNKPLFIRRARGYVPLPIEIPIESKKVILACGAELKNTFCLLIGKKAYLSQHIGDLENIETFNFFKNAIKHFTKLFRANPEIVAHDRHPMYLSTEYALNFDGEKIAIQHHHAHIASVLAEHNINESVIGFSCDGLGLGLDNTIWGGELLLLNGIEKFDRIGFFEQVCMPGGDLASKEPRRMALSYMANALGIDNEIVINFAEKVFNENIEIILKQIKNKINSPMTSSLGRLFDAVSSMIRLVDINEFEGHAAIMLEHIANESVKDFYNYNIKGSKNLIFETKNIILEILEDLRKNIDPFIISAKFHNTIAKIIIEAISLASNEYGINKIAFSGGVFQNIYLLKRIKENLKGNNLEILINELVPPNDGNISLGQAYIAAKMLD
ncbi:MAG: carbamoyltransferase HypF [Nitrososphaerota archaeon]